MVEQGKVPQAAQGHGVWRPIAYTALNTVSGCAIVLANKLVLSTYGWRFPVALTWIHTVFTMFGMDLLAFCGFYTRKPIPRMQLLPLSLAYIGYIVVGNLSLQLNSVGLAQVLKIAVVPTVLLFEFILMGKKPSLRVIAAVGLACVGVAGSTVSDSVAFRNALGLVVGIVATVATAAYNVLCASKQKELQASSAQLLQSFAPQACLLLTVMVPVMEPVGWKLEERGEHTLLGFPYTPGLIVAIIVSSQLGVLVSLSTFLVIGVTSSLTYNVVANLKVVITITAGVLLFGDAASWARVIGVGLALCGIIWYTLIISSAQPPKASTTASDSEDQDVIVELKKKNQLADSSELQPLITSADSKPWSKYGSSGAAALVSGVDTGSGYSLSPRRAALRSEDSAQELLSPLKRV